MIPVPLCDMSDWTLTTEGHVSVVTMTSGENRLSPETLEAWSSALDELEQRASPQALVVTGRDQYWCTGLDLDAVEGMSQAEQATFLEQFDRLLGRILIAPFVTIAALNGHAYAGGALLALAFDYRVMRSDRGFFCLPSVDIGIPFSRGMTELITAKLPQPTAHDLVVSCRRIAATEAVHLGAVNRAEQQRNVMPVSMEMAHAYADKDPATLTTVKRRMYHDAVELLLGAG
jgi:enoyl-CoA hydratase/carnithine racemase